MCYAWKNLTQTCAEIFTNFLNLVSSQARSQSLNNSQKQPEVIKPLRMTNQVCLKDVTESSLPIGTIQVERLPPKDLSQGAWLVSLTGCVSVLPGLYSCLHVVNYISSTCIKRTYILCVYKLVCSANHRIITFLTTMQSYKRRPLYLSTFSSLGGMPFF